RGFSSEPRDAGSYAPRMAGRVVSPRAAQFADLIPSAGVVHGGKWGGVRILVAWSGACHSGQIYFSEKATAWEINPFPFWLMFGLSVAVSDPAWDDESHTVCVRQGRARRRGRARPYGLRVSLAVARWMCRRGRRRC